MQSGADRKQPTRRPVSLTIAGERYDLTLIGSGGTAEIYRTSPELGNKSGLTLKIMKSELVGSERVRKRFEQEYKLIGKLDHHGLPKLVARGSFTGRVFFAYEYVAGRTLLDVLRIASGNGLSLETATLLMGQLLEILSYLHQHKPVIVHGDISPENLILNGNRLCLIDFGSAQHLDNSADSVDQWIGKPSYLSPEQARGLRWDHRSDLYQAGIIFFELLTGRKLNPGQTERDARPLAANPPALGYTAVPRELKPFFKRILAPYPDWRWPDSQSCLDALDRSTFRQVAAAPGAPDRVKAFLA